LYIIFTFRLQCNSTQLHAVTTFELHIDEEVDNDNKLYKWHKRFMVLTVRGTNSQWYEKYRHPSFHLGHSHIVSSSVGSLPFEKLSPDPVI